MGSTKAIAACRVVACLHREIGAALRDLKNASTAAWSQPFGRWRTLLAIKSAQIARLRLSGSLMT
ncbi:MAG: hypothetical protein AAGD08_19535 [Pseudomonadota bacterium]